MENLKKSELSKRQKKNLKKKDVPGKTGPPVKGKKKQPVPKATISKAVEKKYGGRGFDIRTKNLTNFACADGPAGLNSMLDVSVSPNVDSLTGTIIGFVSQLRAIGFGASVDELSFPYFLTYYLYTLLLTVMRGELLPVQQVPRCLLNFFQAMTPKTVRYKNGQINYNWDMTDVPDAVPTIISYGGIPYNMGVVGQVQPWSLMFSTIEPPAAYTPDLGAQAYTSMTAFIQTQALDKFMHELVPPTTLTYCSKDVSAFSTTYNEVGAAFGAGGQTVEMYNAVKIRCPLFATFADYEQTTMMAADARIGASSPRYLGSRLFSLITEQRLGNKFKPIFKPVDFNDLWNSFNFTLGTALEIASTSQIQSVDVYTCPLQASQVALIMRAALASLNFVAAASDVSFPDESFVPLQFHYAAMNVATVIKAWQVPFVFAENIRSLGIVAAGMPSEAANQIMVFAPVFGVYENLTDYNFTYGDGTNIYTVVEAPQTFNMVTLATNSTDYICPVAQELSDAISLWNTWITQFTAVLRLTTFSSSNNNSALYSIMNTRYTQLAPTPLTTAVPLKGATRQTSRKIVPRFKDIIKVVRTVNPSQSISEQEIAISSNLPILNEVYQLTSNWVLPKFRTRGATTTQFISKFYGQFYEPFHVQGSPSKDENGLSEFVSLDTKWRALATISTNAPSSSPNILMDTLLKADEEGHGGFLSQILADFAATQLNIPLISTLGGLLPF